MNNEQERLEYIENQLSSQLDSFREKMKDVADEVMGNVYCDVLPYLVSDTESNIGDRVKGCVDNLITGRFEDISTDTLSIFLRVSDGYGMHHHIHISQYTSMFDNIYKMFADEIRNEKIKALEGEVEQLKQALGSRNGYY